MQEQQDQPPIPLDEVALIIDQRVHIDPLFFSRVILGVLHWPAQQRILRAVRKHRRTLCLSGHAVGKTHVLASLVIEWMLRFTDARVVITASTNRQVHDVIWAEVKRQYNAARVPLGGRFMEREWVIGDTRRAVAVSVDDPTAMQGVHSEHVLVVVDEAEGVDARTWDAMDSLLTSPNCRIVACANPVTPSGRVFEQSNRPDVWHVERISCLEHPNITGLGPYIAGAVTKEWIEEQRRIHGEASPVWQSRVLGEYPRDGSSSLVTREMLDNCASIQTGITEQPRAGLDVARFGSDRSVLAVFDASRTLIRLESWGGSDLMETTGRALAIAREHGALLRVDSCGVGGGVVDRLTEQGEAVDPVDFGAAPAGDWPDLVPQGTTFANRRAELHWVMRSLLREKAIRIGADFRDVWADLMLPKIRYDSRGRIAIESKDDIRKRAGRSPDFGDAVILAMSNASSMPSVFIL